MTEKGEPHSYLCFVTACILTSLPISVSLLYFALKMEKGDADRQRDEVCIYIFTNIFLPVINSRPHPSVLRTSPLSIESKLRMHTIETGEPYSYLYFITAGFPTALAIPVSILCHVTMLSW